MSRGKILVVGAAEAGKSTLINALCPGAMNLSVRGRTVAMDHATLQRDGYRLSLVGVPGQGRFGPVREVLSEGARGAVWVHRAGTDVDRHTVRLMEQLAPKGVGYLVVINLHPGFGGGNGWRAPASLPDPTAVLETDLLRPGSALAELRHHIWSLALDVSSQTTKGA